MVGAHPGRQVCWGTWRPPAAWERELTLGSDRGGAGRGVQRGDQLRNSRSSLARGAGVPGATRHRPLSGPGARSAAPRLIPAKTQDAHQGWAFGSEGANRGPVARPRPWPGVARRGARSTCSPQPAWGGAAENTLSVGPGAGMGQKAEASRVLGTRGPAGQLCLNLPFPLGLPLEALVCSFTSRLASIYSVPRRHWCPGDAATTSTKMRGYKSGWGGGAGGQWTALEREARGV